MKKTDFFAGFTLIELLFIIVIIGIISALSLTTFQQQSLNMRIDKTALQIQQLLEAANNYYATWGCWPNSTTCPAHAPDFSYYLPVGSTKNPWGNSYSYSQDPNQANNFLIFSGSLVTMQNATRVSSILPNAKTDQNNLTQVIASSRAQPSSLIIQYLDSVTLSDANSNRFSFTCPKNWPGTGTVAPTSISAGNQNCLISIGIPTMFTGSKLISRLETVFATPSCTKISGSNEDTYTCAYTLTLQSNRQNSNNGCKPDKKGNVGSATLIQIGFCIPPHSFNQGF